jgi:uncharacterized CHY-type Zn-finger protein
MGYMTLFANCFGCHQLFGSNPSHVPSFRSPSTGEKEPICPACMKAVNANREAKGLAAFPIHPLAYEPEKED